MSELSPRGAHSYQQGRIVRLVGLILVLAGCASEPRPKNYKRTQPEEEAPAKEPKPIETRRLNLGDTHVESQVDPPPPMLSGQVEIKTWADEVIRGRVVEENASGYVIDTAPPDSLNPKIRRVARAAVMAIRPIRRDP